MRRLNLLWSFSASKGSWETSSSGLHTIQWRAKTSVRTATVLDWSTESCSDARNYLNKETWWNVRAKTKRYLWSVSLPMHSNVQFERCITEGIKKSQPHKKPHLLHRWKKNAWLGESDTAQPESLFSRRIYILFQKLHFIVSEIFDIRMRPIKFLMKLWSAQI